MSWTTSPAELDNLCGCTAAAPRATTTLIDVQQQTRSTSWCEGSIGLESQSPRESPPFDEHPVHQAMAFCKDTSAYFQAVAVCPNVVSNESPHDLFLRFCEFNVWNAAQRLAFYWTIREEIFGSTGEDGNSKTTKRNKGQSGAFLPLSRALQPADLAFFMEGTAVVLPFAVNRKGENTCVLLLDRVKRRFSVAKDVPMKLRCEFFFFQKMMMLANGNKNCNFEIMVRINTERMAPLKFDHLFAELARRLTATAMCLNRCSHFHFLAVNSAATPSLLAQVMPKILIRISNWFVSTPTTLHSGTALEVMKSLASSGFHHSGIPTTLGGTWTYERHWPAWIKQQLSFGGVIGGVSYGTTPGPDVAFLDRLMPVPLASSRMPTFPETACSTTFAAELFASVAPVVSSAASVITNGSAGCQSSSFAEDQFLDVSATPETDFLDFEPLPSKTEGAVAVEYDEFDEFADLMPLPMFENAADLNKADNPACLQSSPSSEVADQVELQHLDCFCLPNPVDYQCRLLVSEASEKSGLSCSLENAAAASARHEPALTSSPPTLQTESVIVAEQHSTKEEAIRSNVDAIMEARRLQRSAKRSAYRRNRQQQVKKGAQQRQQVGKKTTKKVARSSAAETMNAMSSMRYGLLEGSRL